MKVKTGTKVEVTLRSTNGLARFPLGFGCASCAGPNNERHSWVTLQVSVMGKHRGVPEKVLFDVDIPLDEAGLLLSNGGHARGVIGWSLDSARERAKRKVAKAMIVVRRKVVAE